MNIPPIDWEDLVAIGMSPDATIDGSQYGCVVTPTPPRLVVDLLELLGVRPAPSGRAAYLRYVRGALLACTDWTQAADSPLTQEQRDAWAAYRQALRDLPGQYPGQGPIPWPKAP